jgi:hypothetical protein
MTGILIPNTRYENELRFSMKWYISGFIAGFAAMVQHDTHITTPKYKNSDHVLMVFTPYPNNPLNEILPYGDVTHFVSVAWNREHYTVLYYDIETCIVTVFDGLHQGIHKWQDHIIHTVKTYGLKTLHSCATCVKLPSFGMALEIRFDDEKEESWYVRDDQSYVQVDSVSCGPIACLKLMEIYGIIPVGSIQEIGESDRGYRHVVMDYYNDCVIRFNDVLKVEIRTKKLRLGKHPQRGNDSIKARTLEAVHSQTARVDTIKERTLEAHPIEERTLEAHRTLEERTLEAHRTLEARKAAMLAVPSPTARVKPVE